MAGAADDLHTRYTTDSANWTGPAAAQYRLYCADQVELHRAASAAAQSVADNARMSGTALTVVREIVRSLITDAAGKAISIACRYPPPATPAAAPEIAVMITDTSSQIVQWVRKLERAFGNAGELLRQSGNLFRKTVGAFKKANMMSNLVHRTEFLSTTIDAVSAVPGAAVKQAVKAIPGQIPEKVFVETAKGAASTSAAMEDEPKPPHDQSQLYDGPGPHRVTGTLQWARCGHFSARLGSTTDPDTSSSPTTLHIIPCRNSRITMRSSGSVTIARMNRCAECSPLQPPGTQHVPQTSRLSTRKWTGYAGKWPRTSKIPGMGSGFGG
jgi:hypothetical protein